MYRITAQFVETVNGWQSSVGLPTVFIDPAYQGCQSVADAIRVAETLLRTIGRPGVYHVSVVDDRTEAYGTATIDTRVAV